MPHDATDVSLSVSFRTSGPMLVATLTGEADLSNLDQLSEALDEAARRRPDTAVALEARQLFLDVQAMRTVAGFAASQRRAGVVVALLGLSSTARLAFDIVDTEGQLLRCDSLADLVARLTTLEASAEQP